MEQLKAQRLWAQSQNAAGMVFDDTSNYSTLEVNYNRESGDFHRPQDGRKVSNLDVTTEGFVNLGNALVWGSFAFTDNNQKDAGYNASITDPYRGMPYYVADSHQSDWRKQFYNLKFRASTPLMGSRWAIGLEGTYKASIAAKQRDPRADTRFYTLELVPGVTYRMNDNHRLGLSLKYTSLKEDSRMENKNSYVDQDYYILYGLGVAIKGIGEGRTANYYGDRWGAALQYNYSAAGLNLLVEAAYDIKSEVVEQNFTTPKKDAGVKDKTASLSLTAYKRGDAYSHWLKAGYVNRHIDGIQYLSQRDESEEQQGWIELHRNIRSTYRTDKASLHYALSKNRGTEYAWKVEAEATYLKQDDEYLLPHSVKNHENLLLTLGGKYNMVCSERLNRRLLWDVQVGYNANLSGEYLYGGTYADYITVTELETNDLRFLTTDYWAAKASLTYSQQVKEDSRTNLFAKLAVNHTGALENGYDRRTYLAFSVGCNF